jgi:hypothetical protein
VTLSSPLSPSPSPSLSLSLSLYVSSLLSPPGERREEHTYRARRHHLLKGHITLHLAQVRRWVAAASTPCADPCAVTADEEAQQGEQAFKDGHFEESVLAYTRSLMLQGPALSAHHLIWRARASEKVRGACEDQSC